MPHVPQIALAAAIFVAAYALILTERLNRALIAMLGAGCLIVLGILSQDEAVHAIDFNTIGLLLGMMVIVTVARETGLFQYLALAGARLVKAHPTWLLVMLGTVTAVCSALLDNVTSMLLLTPVILSLADELKISPWPYLVTAIFACNIGGTATLVGDPPNIMIGSAANLSFNAFLVHLLPLCCLLMLGLFAFAAVMWKGQLRASPTARKRVMATHPAQYLKHPTLLMHCLFTFALVFAGFITHQYTGLQPASVAMGGAVILLLLDTYSHDPHHQNQRVHNAVAQAEWVTLLFFIGLFVLVAGLQKTGAITFLALKMLALTGANLKLAAISVLWGSAILSALVDNIPFVATMIPLLKTMAPTFGTEHATQVLWWSLALGAGLGGNGTLIGSSANLVVAGLATRHGYPLTFKAFLKVGVPFTLLTVAAANAYILLRYF